MAPRSKTLPPTRLQNTNLSAASTARGPIPLFNPTRAVLTHTHPSAGRHHLLWRSRDNRKGRHALLRTPSTTATAHAPKPTSSPSGVLRGLLRMLTYWPYYDVSFLVAVLFTLGSVVWVLNAFFAYLPLVRPELDFADEVTAADVTAFVGATIFEVGSVFLMWEAINENHSACFGWALLRSVEGDGVDELKPDRVGCRHHHHRGFKQLAEANESKDAETQEKIPLSDGADRTDTSSSSADDEASHWIWWPSMEYLRSHLLHELGFVASLAQFVGATVFWISGFTALPNVINSANTGLMDGVFWTPQVVGGIGFIVSGALFMLETQKNWYTPAFGTLGWHVGFWNLVGAFGFTLCGALGYSNGSGEQYQSTLATFWGSWAFLVGSLAQWYEAVNKFPVVLKDH